MKVWLLAAFMLVAVPAAQGQPAGTLSSPVGTWRTFSDVDGRETGQVKITDQGGVFYGVVTRINDPVKAAGLCTLCPDDRKDKPVLGMQVIRGLKPDGTDWSGGQIIDPETGKIYRASMRLEDGGRKLAMRGYIGVSLFGRTQVWTRN